MKLIPRMSNKLAFAFFFALAPYNIFAQPKKDEGDFQLVKQLPSTAIKDQANTGTCWSFATTSLIESQTIKNGYGSFDLSEMFTVRNIYKEKAKNYILRQGKTQFGAGGLGHDVIHAVVAYGAIPESVYSGLMLSQTRHDHTEMDRKLKLYLDEVLKSRPVRADWMQGFESILDDYLGKVPATFQYGESQYTPQSFAKDVLHFNPADYVCVTSFTHHPFYQAFVLEVPDNASNGLYYNVPLDVLLKLTERSIESGYTVMWDGDVSNAGFRDEDGYAMVLIDQSAKLSVDAAEVPCDQNIRQSHYENLDTQDDHLMHIVGMEKSKGGKRFFIIKNSYGDNGPFHGLIHLSENYFALNTISLVLPKAALDDSLKVMLKIN